MHHRTIFHMFSRFLASLPVGNFDRHKRQTKESRRCCTSRREHCARYRRARFHFHEFREMHVLAYRAVRKQAFFLCLLIRSLIAFAADRALGISTARTCERSLFPSLVSNPYRATAIRVENRVQRHSPRGVLTSCRNKTENACHLRTSLS